MVVVVVCELFLGALSEIDYVRGRKTDRPEIYAESLSRALSNITAATTAPVITENAFGNLKTQNRDYRIYIESYAHLYTLVDYPSGIYIYL